MHPMKWLDCSYLEVPLLTHVPASPLKIPPLSDTLCTRVNVPFQHHRICFHRWRDK